MAGSSASFVTDRGAECDRLTGACRCTDDLDAAAIPRQHDHEVRCSGLSVGRSARALSTAGTSATAAPAARRRDRGRRAPTARRSRRRRLARAAVTGPAAGCRRQKLVVSGVRAQPERGRAHTWRISATLTHPRGSAPSCAEASPFLVVAVPTIRGTRGRDAAPSCATRSTPSTYRQAEAPGGYARRESAACSSSSRATRSLRAPPSPLSASGGDGKRRSTDSPSSLAAAASANETPSSAS